ncbi:MAG: hypothetical protein QXT74_00595 [Candidatus Nezhaarchaeales archaeon]
MPADLRLALTLALLFGAPAALLALLALIGRRGLRGAASSLKVELASLLLAVPPALYCAVSIWLGLRTPHPALAAICLALWVLALLVVRKAARSP